MKAIQKIGNRYLVKYLLSSIVWLTGLIQSNPSSASTGDPAKKLTEVLTISLHCILALTLAMLKSILKLCPSPSTCQIQILHANWHVLVLSRSSVKVQCR